MDFMFALHLDRTFFFEGGERYGVTDPATVIWASWQISTLGGMQLLVKEGGENSSGV